MDQVVQRAENAYWKITATEEPRGKHSLLRKN